MTTVRNGSASKTSCSPRQSALFPKPTALRPRRVNEDLGTTTDAGEAVGGRPEPSADLLRQLRLTRPIWTGSAWSAGPRPGPDVSNSVSNAT